MYYCTQEIFAGVKYWRLHISLTFGWYNIGELTFTSYLDGKTKTFGG